MPTYDEYRIGWICALPIECAAVESMLDASHPTLPNRENDGNTYIFGEINGHNIVIACLPYGVYGTTSASLVATNMRISFPSVRFCLIVGIAGGAPSPQYDIRLGDVVVSKPIAGYGGVIQYDYGKAVDGGELVPTGYLDKPPAALLTAIARLQSSHQLLGNNIPHLYEEASRKYPRVRDHFKRPETADDLLFRTEYGHVATWNQDRCEQCDPNMLQKRSLRCSNHPHVFYGLIASANQLLRDAVKRDNLAQRYGILCFEMESAGIMDVFPCLVIRGISDYCDSHKNKRWQGYASISAAAYAKELLSVIPSVNLTSPSVVSLSTSDLPTPTISTPELPTPILSDEPDRSRKLERRNTPRSKSLEPQEKDKSTSDQLRLPDPPVSNRSQSAERPKKETTEHNKLRQPIPRIVTESDSRTQSKENEGSRRAEVQIPRSATSSRPRETAKEDSDTSKTRPGSGARETIHAETPVVANKETNGGRKDKTSTTRAATRPVPIPSISGDHGRSPVTEPEKIAKPKPPKTTKEDAHGQSRRPDEQLNTAIPTSGKDHDKSKSPTKPVLNSPSFKRSNSSRSKDQKADDRSQPIIDTRETSEARPKGRSRSKSQEPPAEKRSSRDRPSLEAQETSRPKLSESPVEKSGRSDQHLLKPKDALRPRSLSAHSRPPDTTGEDRKQASQHLSAPPSIGRSRSIGHAQSGPRKGLDKESVGIKTSQSPQSRAITRAQRDIIEACMVQWGLQVPQSSLKSNTGDILVVGITLGTKLSRVSWATAERFFIDQIHRLTEWPGTSLGQPNVPTKVAYKDGQALWGWGTPISASSVSWLELLFSQDENADHESIFSRRARNAMTDYFRMLWEHITSLIRREYGEEFFANAGYGVVVTLPAISKPWMRQTISDAAVRAGILSSSIRTRITIIWAPEAAALATLQNQSRSVQLGDIMVVCYARTSNADLGLLKVTHMDPIRLRRLDNGTRGACGASPTYDITRLINAQLSNARQKGLVVNGIILAGALGSMPYLSRHLKTTYESASLRIYEFTGPDAESGVCHGSIYKGFESFSSRPFEDINWEVSPI